MIGFVVIALVLTCSLAVGAWYCQTMAQQAATKLDTDWDEAIRVHRWVRARDIVNRHFPNCTEARRQIEETNLVQRHLTPRPARADPGSNRRILVRL